MDLTTGKAHARTIDNVLNAPTMDFIVRASRNLNPAVGTEYQPSVPVAGFYDELTKPAVEHNPAIISAVSELIKNEVQEQANQTVPAAVNNLVGGVFRNGLSV